MTLNLESLHLDFANFDAIKNSCFIIFMMVLKNLKVDLRTGYLMVDLKFGTALSHLRQVPGDQAGTTWQRGPNMLGNSLDEKHIDGYVWSLVPPLDAGIPLPVTIDPWTPRPFS